MPALRLYTRGESQWERAFFVTSRRDAQSLLATESAVERREGGSAPRWVFRHLEKKGDNGGV